MNTIFKRSFFAATSLFSIFLVCSSCEDNIGIKATDEAPNADKTLYEVIMNDSELTDFVEVLNACNVRSKKRPDEIISVADSLFNTSRVYTVWAPKNGTFKKDSIIKRINDGYRDDVMKTFVFSHIANYLKAAKGKYDEDGEHILMLNDKKLVFKGSYDEGYTFGGKELSEVNNRVKNGIIHKLSSVSEYTYNIWEYIYTYSQNQASLHKVDSLVNYLYSFNDTVFSEYLSIPGPVVNGAETYLDSVFNYENKLLSRYNGGVGNLNNEDSLYTFYLPTNDVWDNMIAKAEKHFNYTLKSPNANIKVDTALIDSLRHYYPRHNIIKYLAYSEIEQRDYKYSADSVMPVQYEYPRKHFARSVFNEEAVVDTKVLSNGTIKVINEFPYSMFDLWHDTIRIEAEDMGLLNIDETESEEWIKRYNVSDKAINKEAGTKISGQYISFGDENNTKNKLCYYIPGVKSATYKVALIFVPRNITSSKVNPDDYKKPRFRCTVKQYFPATGLIDNVASSEANIQPAKDRIDTLYLKKLMTFPICEYNIATKVENYTAKIYIEGYNGTSSQYDNTIRLDAILLIPVEDAE